MKPIQLFLGGLFFCLPFPVRSQASLDAYIRQGLQSNLVLQQRQIAVSKSVQALAEARSYFLPAVDLAGQYTLAQGGRSIDIPVGDLLNPVYQTLNQLTASSKFPMISNRSEQFLPNNFYDVRLHTSMPLVNPDLVYNKRIKEEELQWSGFDLDIYRRQLLRDIKVAYYNYLLCLRSIDIYENARQLVSRNLRNNQALLANGKGLPAYVLRAESELQQVESQGQMARSRCQNARAYFNFLINRPLTDSIVAEFPAGVPPIQALSDSSMTNNPIANREELKLIQSATRISGWQEQMTRHFRVPRVNAFLDLGTQGFDFTLNKHSFLYLAGIQVQLPIFAGKRYLSRIESAQLNRRSLGLQEEQLKQQLRLSAQVAWNNLQDARADYAAAFRRNDASQAYFRLVERGYGQGVNTFIEYLDARNQSTDAGIQLNLDFFRILIAQAEWERETASYSFN